MSDNKTYNMLNNVEKNSLRMIISGAIDKYFKILEGNEKKMLKEYLYKTCILLSIYFYDKNFINQVQLNDCRDIYGMLVLLLPYYELNESSKIQSLEEILFNKNNKGSILLANFDIDHSYITPHTIEAYLSSF
jgi:hypothetical protein